MEKGSTTNAACLKSMAWSCREHCRVAERISGRIGEEEGSSPAATSSVTHMDKELSENDFDTIFGSLEHYKTNIENYGVIA